MSLESSIRTLFIFSPYVDSIESNDYYFLFISLKLQDALSHTEFELMELLDVDKEEVTSAMAHVSEVVCPPCQTVDILRSLLFDVTIIFSSLFRNY